MAGVAGTPRVVAEPGRFPPRIAVVPMPAAGMPPVATPDTTTVPVALNACGGAPAGSSFPSTAASRPVAGCPETGSTAAAGATATAAGTGAGARAAGTTTAGIAVTAPIGTPAGAVNLTRTRPRDRARRSTPPASGEGPR